MSKVIEFIKEHDREDALCLKCLTVTDFEDYELINGIDYIIWKCPKCKMLTKTKIED